ncbi:MAG: C39 family peptidase [Anaerolineales bacterium]
MKRVLFIITLSTLLLLVDFSTAQGDSLPESAYVSGVNGHTQGYSLSCEARSAADWAAYWGVSIGETEFLQAMPSSDNPEVGFVGNPNEAWGRIPPHGYGVYAEPVAETLRDFGLEAEAHRDLSWDDLRKEISAGRPVIVWVIGQMWAGTPVDYEAKDGSTVRVAAFEHTMILTGYNSSSVQVVDAYTGQYQYYWVNTFLKSWSVLGNMAVLGSGENKQQESLPEAHGGTYSVQKGDYLIALAKRFGIDWQELADLNSLSYPFTIHPGDMLQLPEGEIQEAMAEPEPEPTVSPPAVWEVNFRIHLPIVGRNVSAQATDSDRNTSSAQAPIEKVMVLQADTLLNFAHSIDADWLMLVELNKISYPYVVYPGQVLRVR